MRTNYANFAQTIVTAPNSVITSLTGTVVTSDLFPASNFYAVIEQEVSGIIIKREIVKVTTRTDESFIVVRGQDGTIAQDFTMGGGTVYLSINTVAGNFNDLRDETESLDDRITDNEGDITTNSDDIDILEWFTTTLDADLITLENSAVLKTGDQAVAGVKTFSSSPIVPTPTTSTQVASKGYVDGIVGFTVVSGDIIVSSSDGTVFDGNTTYVKVKDIEVSLAGTYKIGRIVGRSSSNSTTLTTRLYIDGVAVGVENSQPGDSGDSPIQYEENITVTAGQNIQLYAKTALSGRNYIVSNFRVKASFKPNSATGTVVL